MKKSKGIVGFLGAIVGKEVSEELIHEFQDELDDIIQILKSNKGLEHIPNLELESYEMKVANDGDIVKGDFKTKIEHKKVLGIFITHRVASGGFANNPNSTLSIKVDRNFVLAQGLFHYNLIEKTPYLTVYEAAWRTDIKINTSDVTIEYRDGSTVGGNYSAFIHFICQK